MLEKRNMKIVIDTNVIISGVFFNGKPRELLSEYFNEEYEIDLYRRNIS